MKSSVQQLNFLWELGMFGRIPAAQKFIWVRRRNVFAQAVSLWTAEQDGNWTSLHGGSDRVPEFDEERILLAARTIYEANAWFEMFFSYHDIQPLVVWYEDYADDETRLIAGLKQHYGISAEPGISALPVARQTSSQKVLWANSLHRSGRASGRPIK